METNNIFKAFVPKKSFLRGAAIIVEVFKRFRSETVGLYTMQCQEMMGYGSKPHGTVATENGFIIQWKDPEVKGAGGYRSISRGFVSRVKWR